MSSQNIKIKLDDVIAATTQKQDEIELLIEQQGGLNGLQEIEISLILQEASEAIRELWREELQESLRQRIKAKGIFGR